MFSKDVFDSAQDRKLLSSVWLRRQKALNWKYEDLMQRGVKYWLILTRQIERYISSPYSTHNINKSILPKPLNKHIILKIKVKKAGQDKLNFDIMFGS